MNCLLLSHSELPWLAGIQASLAWEVVSSVFVGFRWQRRRRWWWSREERDGLYSLRRDDNDDQSEEDKRKLVKKLIEIDDDLYWELVQLARNQFSYSTGRESREKRSLHKSAKSDSDKFFTQNIHLGRWRRSNWMISTSEKIRKFHFRLLFKQSNDLVV